MAKQKLFRKKLQRNCWSLRNKDNNIQILCCTGVSKLDIHWPQYKLPDPPACETAENEGNIDASYKIEIIFTV